MNVLRPASFPDRLRAGTRIGLALLLLLVTGTVLAAGTRIELQTGRSYMSGKGKGATAAFAEGIFPEHSIGSSRFTWAPDFSAGWIDGRSVPRLRDQRYTAKDHIWLVAAGARFRYGTPSDWYHHLFFSFQPTLHTGRTRALSSVYEFASTFGWQARWFSVEIRHISNGALHEPNCGETMLLLGVWLP